MDRFRPMQLPALMAALALVLAACAGADEPTPSAAEPTQTAAAEASPSAAEEESPAPEESEAAGEEARVRLDAFNFDQTELTVAAGTEVSFVNADTAAHTVTEGVDGQAADDPIIDEELAQNASTSFTFDEPGTYEITCLFHSSMNIAITVEG